MVDGPLSMLIVWRGVATCRFSSGALWAASPVEKRLVDGPPSMLIVWGGVAARRFSSGEAARRADEVFSMPHSPLT